MFLTVALIHDMCAPAMSMIVVGIVTTGNAVLGIAFPGPLAFLVVGVAALAYWYLVLSRKPEPVIDARSLGRPLVLTLLVVMLTYITMATGAIIAAALVAVVLVRRVRK